MREKTIPIYKMRHSCYNIWVPTGPEMVRKKILQGEGKVGKFYFESGKNCHFKGRPG